MRVILLGPPGAGKGTQAQFITEQYSVPQISTGDMLRAAKTSGTEMGNKVAAVMEAGQLVTDEIVIGLIAEKLDGQAAGGFIFDGFPRTESQAAALDTFLAEKGEQINGMVALEVPEDILVTRLLERGKTSGRADDTDESKIRNRFNEYNTKTAVLKDYFQAQNKYYGINGVGSIEEITQRITTVFDTL